MFRNNISVLLFCSFNALMNNQDALKILSWARTLVVKSLDHWKVIQR